MRQGGTGKRGKKSGEKGIREKRGENRIGAGKWKKNKRSGNERREGKGGEKGEKGGKRRGRGRKGEEVCARRVDTGQLVRDRAP